MNEVIESEYNAYRASMTKEQREAYDFFIDYMVELYNKYGHLFGEEETEE